MGIRLNDQGRNYLVRRWKKMFFFFSILFLTISKYHTIHAQISFPKDTLIVSNRDFFNAEKNISQNHLPEQKYSFPLELFKRDTTNKKLLYIGIAGYATTLTVVSTLWYGPKLESNFKFFFDIDEWNQVDKAGHFYTSFQLSRTTAQILRKGGLSDKKSALWGTLIGIGLMTPIEILDGFSPKYGYSWADFGANTAGSLFFFAQQSLWNEIRITPKFSYHPTNYPRMRNALDSSNNKTYTLGKDWTDQWLKDYNGQTYWLSFDIDKFLNKGNKFPKWLNFAVGYGADQMIYATDNVNQKAGFQSVRKFYFGLDWDLTAIKTRNPWIKSLLYALNLIKLPAPTIEYNSRDGFQLYGLYF